MRTLLLNKTRWVQCLMLTLVGMIALVGLRLPATAHPTVDIVASNWKFTPAKIQVPVGKVTKLSLTSSAGVHGLQSNELGMKLTTIKPGEFQVVTIKPMKAGTFVLHCAIMCGPGHSDMVLTIQAK